jgi:hypothetical protein
MGWPSAVREWGSTAYERERPYPCDALLSDADETVFRAVDVEAPAPLLFRWLCQLRVAPYSYDLLDNLGRRSPQTLTPGLERLEPGQTVGKIFRLIEFEPDRSITLFSSGRVFGDVAATYLAEPDGAKRSRLVVKLLVDYARMGPQRHLMSPILPPGDLFMMRRQLLNLKRLAERDAVA